jgi:site-specific DNA-cytosine methylase
VPMSEEALEQSEESEEAAEGADAAGAAGAGTAQGAEGAGAEGVGVEAQEADQGGAGGDGDGDEREGAAGWPRFFTPRESARIQGFPDAFAIDRCRNPNNFYHQIGNAVSPPVIQAIAGRMLQVGRQDSLTSH